MKILDARIDWMLEYANYPDLEVLVDKFPESFRYRRRGSLWWAEKDGIVSFLAHSGEDRNEGGFGGAWITITLEDGTEKILKDPWSSRAGVMNKAGFPRSVDAFVYQESWDTYSVMRAITLNLAKNCSNSILKTPTCLR